VKNTATLQSLLTVAIDGIDPSTKARAIPISVPVDDRKRGLPSDRGRRIALELPVELLPPYEGDG
jgi:hypothetical protein